MTEIMHRNDALELFSLVVYIYEQNQFKKGGGADIYGFHALGSPSYTSESFISAALRKYKDVVACEAIGAAIYSRDGKNSKRFYNFANKVRYDQFVTITSSEINDFLRYISKDNGSTMPKQTVADFIVTLRKTQLERAELTIPQKQFALHDSKWWLYYADSVEGQLGVTAALLSYGNFGKVTVTNYHSRIQMLEEFHGYFSIYKENFLQLELQQSPSHRKDLRINLYVGWNAANPFMLGTYHNVGRQIIAGKVIVKKIDAQEDLKALADPKAIASRVKFYSNPESDTSVVPSKVFEFLYDRPNNVLSIPSVSVLQSELDQLKPQKHPKTGPKTQMGQPLKKALS